MAAYHYRIALLCLLVLVPTTNATPRTDALGDPLPDAAISRFGSTRLRHPGPIQALVWSPDGKLIASVAWREDCSVRLWDAKTGRLVRSLGDYRRATNCLAFSADSKSIAGGTDGRVHVWDVDTGKEITTLDAITKADRDDFANMRPFGGIGSAPNTQAVVYSPDGKTLFVCTSHRHVLYDAKTFERRVGLTEPRRLCQHAVFTPDGSTLVTGESGSTVDFWDAQTGKHRRGFEMEGPPRHVNIFGLAMSHDGKHAALKLLKAIVVIEVETGKVVWREPCDSYGEEPVALSCDSLLALAGKNGVRVWDWRAKKLVADITEGGELTRRVCFAPDGKRLAWSGADGNIRIWDVAEKKEALPQVGHRGEVRLFALRADGKQFATVDYAKTLRIWDTAKGDIVHSRALTDFPYPACMAFPPDGRTVVFGDSWSHVAVYESTGEKKPVITTGPEKERYLRTFDADGGTALATDPYSLVTHFLTGQGAEWVKYTGPKLHSYDARFSADGKYIFNSGWDYLTYLDAKTHREIWRVIGYANPNFVRGSLACSPDGRFVAAGITSVSEKRESVIRIWDTKRGDEWKVLKSPQVIVSAAAFSADNRFLVTASADYDGGLIHVSPSRSYIITLWDVASGAEIARFSGHESVVRSLAFAPDSKTFYSASNDGTVLQWDWLGLAVKDADSPKLSEQTWSDLGDREGSTVYRALQQLAASPKESTRYLSERLQPPPAVTREMIARLKQNLDHDNFKVRDAAERELDALGEQAIGPLEDALLLRLSAEAEQRILKLLKERGAKLYPADELRRMRAVLALERIGDGEAKKLLDMMAASKADVLSVRQAREALERIKNRER